MTQRDVVTIVAARYQFGHFFIFLLDILIARVRKLQGTAKISRVLVNNLLEELGKIKEYGDDPHSVLRKDLLVALGVNYDQWIPKGTLNQLGDNVHPAAKAVITGFYDIITFESEWDPWVGLGMIAESERLVIQHYRYIVLLLKRHCPHITEYLMRHLLTHIEHDEFHAGDLDELLEVAEHKESVEIGRLWARYYWNKFWTIMIGHPLPEQAKTDG